MHLEEKHSLLLAPSNLLVMNNNQSPNETPSFAKLQALARSAAVTEECIEKGIECVTGAFNPETGEMWFTTPNLEEMFKNNPELQDALERKLKRTFFGDADPTTSL